MQEWGNKILDPAQEVNSLEEMTSKIDRKEYLKCHKSFLYTVLWSREKKTVTLHGSCQGRFPRGDDAWDKIWSICWVGGNRIFKGMAVGVTKG